MAVIARMENFEGHPCIHSYHIYKDIWEAADGEELLYEREPRNDHDRYAVAVKKKGGITGHLPRKIASVLAPFEKRRQFVAQQQVKDNIGAICFRVESKFLAPSISREHLETHKLKFWKS